MSDVEIRLSDRPDGFGFIPGEARRGDTVVRVNILPPEPLWAGSIMLEEYQPDALAGVRRRASSSPALSGRRMWERR